MIMSEYEKKAERIFIVVPLRERRKSDVFEQCQKLMKAYQKKTGKVNVLVTNTIFSQFMKKPIYVLSKCLMDMQNCSAVIIADGCHDDFMCSTLETCAGNYGYRVIQEKELMQQ